MFDLFGDTFMDMIHRGGVVMWPLLLMSVTALTLMFERCWFWLRTHGPRRRRMVTRMARMLRHGDLDAARSLAREDRSVYGRVVTMLLDEPISEALVVDAVETQRPRLERFMATLSTIITAAPMLGILGTVLGIISSFRLLGNQAAASDPRLVSQGIAEALLTTAAGLLLALVVLLPYNAFRSQVDRALGRIETLVTAATQGREIHDAAKSATDKPVG